MMRAALCGLILLCACGDSDKKTPVAPHTSKKDAGDVTDPTDGPDAKTDAGSDLLAPVVTFTAPTPASDPNTDTVVTATTLAVRCSVARSRVDGSSAVDKTSVKITLEQPSDTTKLIAPAVNAVGDDAYEATFELGTLPNGRLRFHCSAKDLATTPRSGESTLDTFLDLGPKIEFTEPSATIYALKTPVPIEFTVSPSPLSDADQEQAPKSIKLVVAGLDFEAVESTTTPGLYQLSVDFDDTTLFKQPPMSAQILVSATDNRTPTAPVREAKLDISIDAEGPTITISDPKDGQIVHGEVTLKIEVSDPAGVQRSSVVADINNRLQVIREWDGTPPKFQQTFDTRKFGTQLTQLTINITASDAVGNESKSKPLTLKLDNVPPVISLDPPAIHEWKRSNGVAYCSVAFDPVGDDAVSDLADVENIRHYRALVEDRTNQPVTSGSDPGVVTYLAGTKTSTVELFMQRDLNVPLLIDKDGDKHCDQINYEDVDLEQRPAELGLSAVNPTGAPWYMKRPSGDTTSCLDPNGSETAPSKLCDNAYSTYTRIVPGRIQGRPPAVYAIRPSNTNGSGECAGESWELLSIAREGWNCLAARVEDNIGNVGVSAPLRICFDDPNTASHPACKTDKSQPPSCSDGCDITAAQKFSGSETTWYFP